MAGAIEFILKLADQFSGPAQKAADSAAKLTDKVQPLSAAAEALPEHLNAGAEAAAKLDGMTQGTTKSVSGLTTAGDSLIESMGGEVAIIEKLIAAYLALGVAATAVFLGGAALAIKASDMKGDMIDVYKNLLGSEQAAKDTFDQVQKIAKTVPQSAEQVHQIATRLLAAGVSKALLADTIKAMADLEAAAKIMGNPEAASKLEHIIEKASQTGKFAIPEKALVGTGVELSDLYAALAKRLHVGVDQVAALLKAGKISASDGIDALNEVIEKKFGKIAGKQLLDLDTQWQKFKDTISELFQDVDAGPLLGFLHSILGLFDKNTATGARLKTIIEGLYNWFFALFSTIDTKSLESGFNAVLDAVEGVVGVFKFLQPYLAALGGGFMAGLMEGFKAFSTVLKTIGGALGGLGPNSTIIQFLTLAGKGFGYLVVVIGAFLMLMGVITGTVMAVFGVMASLVGAIVGALGSVVSYLVGLASDFFGAAGNIGGAIIDGIVGGITSGASAVINAITGVASGAIDAAKAALGIHSPSRAFEKLGMFTSMGFAQGIENDNSGVDAVGGMLSTPSTAGAQAAGNILGGQAAAASGGGAAKGGGINITLTVDASGHKDPAAVGDAVKAAVAEALEGVALQFGAAAA